jgi:hypothetical protein
VSQKIRENGVKNRPCLSLQIGFKNRYFWGEFGRFSRLNANFLSEAGEVLTFFASFFVSRQKMKWGLGAKPQLA